MWERLERGRALYTMQPSASEIAALRARLLEVVGTRGLGALVGDGLVARDFVCFAATFIAESADRLSWYPVLRELGVPPDDARRYRGARSPSRVVGESKMVNRWSTGPAGPASRGGIEVRKSRELRYLEEWPSGLRHRF